MDGTSGGSIGCLRMRCWKLGKRVQL
uniref:Uncharacterized protein n=1 Tax=Anguilla anguilla TaxID=7936 RepID=A0A0E9PF94_ANGAN